jgi:hypothetical protein
MKKCFFLSIFLFALISCEEDVRFNNPSFQGVKDNVFWRAVASTASLGPNGSLVIEAYTGNEVITLKITSTLLGTYTLGNSTEEIAAYVVKEANSTVTFTTGLGKGNGQIVLTEYDPINRTVSGVFKFNAENSSNNPLEGTNLNFQQGVFYKVPISAP